MELAEIRHKIKQAVAKVSRLNPDTIADEASFREDLGLDSLSVIETLVEVQFRFKLGDLPESELSGLRTVADTVQLVQRHLCLEMV